MSSDNSKATQANLSFLRPAIFAVTDSVNAGASRRTFLASLLAGAGSLALAGCGGAGGSSDSAVANTSAKAKAAVSESAQGTTIPPFASFTDAYGTPWTLSNGSVLGNNMNTGFPGSAVLMVYWNHSIYGENSAGGWYVYGANGWNATSDPRVSAATATSADVFYGVNGHMAWPSGIYETMSAAQQLALLKDLGVTNYRADVAGSGMAQTIATALAGPFAGSGVSILPVINPMSYDQTASETDAYNLGYELAVSIATPLKGLVSVIECGNELDANGLVTFGAGNSPAEYNPAYWPAYRGVLRGMIDGVKSVDSSIKCGINVGIPLAYTALQMLWQGITPDGSSTGQAGATPLAWDITMYHWYESSGLITEAGPQGLTNVLQILQQSFGLPIWITEWGFVPSDSAAQQASYVAGTLAEYNTLRQTYNLQSVMFYELIDVSTSDGYGLVQSDGVTKTEAYSAFKNYVAANPV
ncbi:glycosyl hydrolase [Paraburkholderia sp. DHOC27]|uniref:glycosyl hydrolase n=1 Tax=Paraburkholderia sp. DHOC27 TaxID=2303330 RepID=UPI000E3C993D|nr:glycosyl hydrolase [Paraburkholderia sp. DHOC27]RFU47499.1 glycosyl hydrolase [Paraburkholderia sp. DHOC27]